MSNNTQTETIIKRDVSELLEDQMLDFYLSTLYGRTIGDVRDGLKPVHRRVLYSALTTGLRNNAPFRKSASLVGHTLGEFHPHGDITVYETSVRLTQDFALNVPLMEGHGNMGNPLTGDSAAAMRYCVVGDTRILQHDGSFKKIGSIANIPENSEIDINGTCMDYKKQAQIYRKFFNSGKHPVYKLTTDFGYEIKGTSNHPLLILNDELDFEWRTMENIKSGDRVIINKNPSTSLQYEMESKKKEYIKNIAIDIYNNNINDEYDLNIPDIVFESNISYQRIFLSTFYNLNNNSKQTVRSKSKKFLKDLQLLMLNQGQVTFIVGDALKIDTGKNFIPGLNSYIKKVTDNKISKIFTYEDYEKYKDEIKNNITDMEFTKLEDRMRSLKHNLVMVVNDEVKKEKDEEVVYSIKVDTNDHSFIANGFINHNTEIKLSKFGEDVLLKDLDKNAVDMMETYDNTSMEPTVLPSRTLNLLINGSTGISGGGYAQEIPPHNLNEVCDIIIEKLKNPDKVDLDYISDNLIPDFPTGGYLCSRKDIVNAYKNGRGNVRLRSNIEILSDNELSVRDIVYGKTISAPGQRIGIIKSITNAIADDKITGISDIVDMSSNKDADIRIKLKRNQDPNIIINQLYKYTHLEDTIKMIFVIKNDDKFKTYNIEEIFDEWIDFRRDTIRRIHIHDIQKHRLKIHELNGLLIAIDNIDEIVEIIKNSPERSETESILIDKFNFTEAQVEVVLNLKLNRLHQMERDKIDDEIDELQKIVDDLAIVINNPDKLDELIIKEQEEIKTKYGNPRKTSLIETDTDIDIEDMIKDEENTIVITKNNNVKRLKMNLRTQRRNTKGRDNHGDGEIKKVFNTNIKDNLLCFTNKGRVLSLKVHEIREGTMKSKGVNISNYITLKNNETITSYLCLSDDSLAKGNDFIIMATKNGYIKKTKLELFSNIRKSGIIAISLEDGDELLFTNIIETNNKMQDIILTTLKGSVIRFSHEDLRPVNRDTRGVIGINMDNDDKIIDMNILDDENNELLFATKKGLGKRVLITDIDNKDVNQGFPRQKRASTAKGRIGIRLNDKDELIGCKIIDSNSKSLTLVSKNNILSVDLETLPLVKRPAYGSSLMDLSKDDELININID